MRSIANIFALMLLSTLCLSAQVPMQRMSNLTRAQLDSIMNPTLHAGAEKVLYADRLSDDLGKLSETDSPVTRAFRLRNVSAVQQRVSRVRTTCGCTVAKVDTAAIPPGEETVITLTYNPKNRPGTIDVDAFVYLEGYDRQPMARLSLYGEVADNDEWRHLPQTMGTLRLKRKEVRFAELPAHGRPSMRILCANSGSKPLRLTSRLLPYYATFCTEPAVIAPGEEADIVVSVDVDKLPEQDGTIRASFLIEGTGGRPSERMLQLIINR